MNIRTTNDFHQVSGSLSAETCERAYEMLLEPEYSQDETYMHMLNAFVESCIRYASYRISWNLYSYAQKTEIDPERTRHHNQVIADAKSLYNYMENTGMNSFWFDRISENRKTIGDFACYVAYVQGVNAR